MYKMYIVRLPDQERRQLATRVRRGRAHARKVLYTRILLKADADGPDRWTDERIAEALEVSTATRSAAASFSTEFFYTPVLTAHG